MSIVASMLTEKDVESSRRLFMALDESGDGLISLNEIAAKLGEQTAKQIFTTDEGKRAHLDKKEFTYLEFIAATFDRKKCLTKDVCKTAFLWFDKNDDGTISLAELVSGRMLGRLSAEEVALTLGDLDKDGNQEIDFTEFMQMMRQDNKA